MIVNFLNPFELEKTDQMKQILLANLEFVGSKPSQHRALSDIEKKNYPDYGDWALLEIWTLRRRPLQRQVSPQLAFAPAPRDDVPELPQSPSKPKKSPSYKDLPSELSKPKIRDALVVAAAQLSSLDSLSGP